MARKISPELREAIRQTNEEGLRARAFIQDLIDRHEARKLEERQRRDRRQQLLRRLIPFRHGS